MNAIEYINGMIENIDAYKTRDCKLAKFLLIDDLNGLKDLILDRHIGKVFNIE